MAPLGILTIPDVGMTATPDKKMQINNFTGWGFYKTARSSLGESKGVGHAYGEQICKLNFHEPLGTGAKGTADGVLQYDV